MLKIAVIGYGGRGRMYCELCSNIFNRSHFKVVAVIDNAIEKLALAKKDLNLDDNQLFTSLKAFCDQPKVADYLFICTQDKEHFEHSIMALNCGYHLLLEKPIACSVSDCVEIAKLAKLKNLKVDVCHVLRYSGYYEKIKEVIDSGILGKIISIEQIENVGYWHMAHSYVRGNWRRAGDSNPMILAKCCHDLDTAVFMANSKCKSVTSVGKLNYFTKENAPAGATEYCMQGCAAKKDCPYDCEKIYIDTAKKMPKACLKHAWPHARLMDDYTVTIPKLYEACNNTQFGKCVFLSDNDVVDHQVTTMVFENGITSTLIMTAFSDKIYRETTIRGAVGELKCNMDKHNFVLTLYGKKEKNIRLSASTGGSHGGGDSKMINALANGKTRSNIEMSIESHLIGFAAEQSRLSDGKPIFLEDLRD